MQVAAKLYNNEGVKEKPKDIFKRKSQFFQYLFSEIKNAKIRNNYDASQYHHRPQNTFPSKQSRSCKEKLIHWRVAAVITRTKWTHSGVKFVGLGNYISYRF